MRTMTPQLLVVHHEAGNAGFDAVNEYHRKKWNFKSSMGYYIGYHYYIDKEGNVYQGRQENELGAHTRPNDGKIGICLMGNFEKEEPTLSQIKSLENLLTKLKSKYNWGNDRVKGHCELSATLCPGKHLKIWLENYKKRDLNFIQKQIYEIQKMIENIKKALDVLKNS